MQTSFGSLTLTAELEKIYNLPRIQRLRDIQQLGAAHYWLNFPSFFRLELALDILFLLDHFSASPQEKIAGLVTGVSDPVFSEVSDIIFGQKKYVDSNISRILADSGINKYLTKYDLEFGDILPNSNDFKKLNQPYPHLSAYNIAFFIQAGRVFKMLKPKDIEQILKNLRFDEKESRWFFVKKKPARKLAHVSLAFSKDVLCSTDMQVLKYLTSQIFKRALALQRITKEDLENCSDQTILQKIDECDDLKLKKLMAKTKHIQKAYKILKKNEGSPDLVLKGEFYGIDPLIYNQHAKKYQQLSKIDEQFKDEFTHAQTTCKERKRIHILVK